MSDDIKYQGKSAWWLQAPCAPLCSRESHSSGQGGFYGFLRHRCLSLLVILVLVSHIIVVLKVVVVLVVFLFYIVDVSFDLHFVQCFAVQLVSTPIYLVLWWLWLLSLT